MPNVSSMPIIRLEIEKIRETILHALPQHAAMMDKNIQEAIKAYCTSENIERVIHIAATEALDLAVKEEVRSFFGGSNTGRRAVREAVIKYLDKWDKSFD